MTKARLHPIWTGGKAGYRYSVIFDGKLLIERGCDPEHDAARALHAMGLTGKLTLLDGKTGIPRTIIDIEKSAKLRVAEESRVTGPQEASGSIERTRIARRTAPKTRLRSHDTEYPLRAPEICGSKCMAAMKGVYAARAALGTHKKVVYGRWAPLGAGIYIASQGGEMSRPATRQPAA